MYSLHYKAAKTELTIGGGLTTYDGNHFGKLTWASNGLTSLKNWYDNDALKTDFNIYLKQQTQLNNYWNLFYDIQYRHVNYKIDGFRNNPGLIVNNKFSFFNPKAGIVYKKDGWKSYLSFSVANKEPNRDDFEAGNTQQPKPERLQDFELGIEKTTKQLNWSATFYYMKYKDQLVLTGKINDVGAYTRTNIPESFRAGIELQGGIKFNSWINTTANLTLSRNKVNDFEEYIDDYDNGGQKINSFSSADIAFSPSITGAGSINVLPFKNTEISFISKYVSKQFLDNTGNNSRSLNSFYVQDIRVIYTIKKKWLKEVTITGQVNNLFNKEYEPNGYTYSYIWGGETITENYYFPMSGTNFIIAVNIRL
ncbi:MAG: TonB-dependent receptor [Chitinophagaceae bacterium]|nr:TonB-dependent receptor [Chitinophagaceae bacterium]